MEISWIYLIIAIIFEVLGTTSMKLSQGFTKILPSIAIFVFYLASLALVTLAVKKIDVSISYPLWAGLGTTLIALIGFFYFKEPFTAIKAISIGLIIAGIIGLNLSGVVR